MAIIRSENLGGSGGGSGNAITALTGDVSASGPGSAAATLATVNSNVGSFTNANITVNAKGLVTAAANGTTDLTNAVILAPNSATRNLVSPTGATFPGLLVKGISGQIADLTDWYPVGGTASLSARITATGNFSNNQGQTSSEAFGDSASVAAAECVAVGKSASASSQFSVVVGYNASGTSSQATVVGGNATSTVDGVALGYSASTAFSGCIAIGRNSVANASASIAIGKQATTNNANELVFGSSSFPINNIYFGKGESDPSPTAYTINGVAGSGTNIAGAALNLAGGQSTGNVNGGSIVFETSAAGASSATLNALANVGQVDGTGTWTLGKSGASKNHIVNGSLGVNSTQSTLTGSAGTAVCSQPFQGATYKKVVVYLSGYTDTGTQTYTYPTAFTNTPYVYGVTAGVSGASATTTTVTFTTTAITGFVFIEGY